MKTDRREKIRIFLGSVEPSYGRRGLDILEFLLEKAGFQTEKAEKDLDSRTFSDISSRSDIGSIGLSLTSERSRESFSTFLERNAANIKVPLIIGGLFADPFLAKELSEQHGLIIYYSRGKDSIVKNLNRALSGERPAPPEKGKGCNFKVWPELEKTAQRARISFLEGSPDLVAFCEDPRQGCPDCPSSFDRTCPLASGYATVKEIGYCSSFVNSFEKAILMIAPADMEIYSSYSKNKEFWYATQEIEELFRKKYDRVFAFRFPLKCPLCPPGECTMPKSKCNYPELLRPLHEEYCIDMANTSTNMAGDRKKIEMFALMLAGKDLRII